MSDRPVHVAQVLGREFVGDSASAADPQLRPFLQQLVAPYSLPLRDDLLEAGRGHSYGEMALAVLAQVTTPATPVDLLLLAHAMPDVVPGRSTATYLSAHCPGAPLSFAVCDQGMAAAFTALAAAHAYVSGGHARRAVLLVLEQSVLHYQPPGPVPIPAGSAAVGLMLATDRGAELSPPVIAPAVAPSEAVARVQAQLTRGSTTVIAGAEFAALLAAARPAIPCVAAPPGQPFTGVWTALASASGTGAEGRTLLADYDPGLGYLCLASLTSQVRPVADFPVDNRSER